MKLKRQFSLEVCASQGHEALLSLLELFSEGVLAAEQSRLVDELSEAFLVAALDRQLHASPKPFVVWLAETELVEEGLNPLFVLGRTPASDLLRKRLDLELGGSLGLFVAIVKHLDDTPGFLFFGV